MSIFGAIGGVVAVRVITKILVGEKKRYKKPKVFRVKKIKEVKIYG